MLTVSAYQKHIDQLLEVAQRLTTALHRAGAPYRVVGGLAVFLHVHERDPMATRSTRDVDIAVNRSDLAAIQAAVEPVGLRYRHAAGVDMLVDAEHPKARSAVHLIFVREKVRPEYLEPVPDFSEAVETAEGAPCSLRAHLRLFVPRPHRLLPPLPSGLLQDLD